MGTTPRVMVCTLSEAPPHARRVPAYLPYQLTPFNIPQTLAAAPPVRRLDRLCSMLNASDSTSTEPESHVSDLGTPGPPPGEFERFRVRVFQRCRSTAHAKEPRIYFLRFVTVSHTRVPRLMRARDPHGTCTPQGTRSTPVVERPSLALTLTPS
eukprot:771116-Prymnesium_polylepis.1